MSNILLNAAIASTSSQILSPDSLTLVKEFADGMIAFANPSGTAVALFADMGDGEFFNASGWVKHPSKSLVEIADSLYS